MIIEKKEHIMYLYRLLGKIKYSEIDEIELSDFIESPYLTELIKEIEPEFRKLYIDHDLKLKESFDNATLEQRHMDLIINRVRNWSPSIKKSLKWNDNKIKNYLIERIDPLKYNRDQLDVLITRFKNEISACR